MAGILELYVMKEEDAVKEEEISENFVGALEPLLMVFAEIKEVAQADLPILIVGESHSQMQLTAHIIHEISGRNEGPFVHVDCAALPKTLLEVELFGYEKGVYDYPHISKKGKIEQADGGTLFLDEVVELSTSVLFKLLRFTNDQVVERIGSKESRKVDVRLITATGGDLEEVLSKGNLWSDLYQQFEFEMVTIHLVSWKDEGMS